MALKGSLSLYKCLLGKSGTRFSRKDKRKQEKLEAVGSISTGQSLNTKGKNMSSKSDEIRARAYAIWEQTGHNEGRSLEHWLRAERELKNASGDSDSQEDTPSVISYLNEQNRKEEDGDSLQKAAEETFPASDPIAATSSTIAGSPKEKSGKPIKE